ncbi:hypothetical protein AVEN_108553-1 [Araneus ventricosus]|uniref:Uncharacterized protein n=1 Tax=Araneus ventricosus TaxID=182803 RepID=A0A4Y2TRT6_ARAVE|nr:hypothetical protein AVEN_108553-1 [Araneus ventricosus]
MLPQLGGPERLIKRQKIKQPPETSTIYLCVGAFRATSAATPSDKWYREPADLVCETEATHCIVGLCPDPHFLDVPPGEQSSGRYFPSWAHPSTKHLVTGIRTVGL